MFDMGSAAFRRQGAKGGPRGTMGRDSASLLLDQRAARERAANYFALFETLRSHEQTEDAWLRAETLLDPAQPFPTGAGLTLGRLDLDDSVLKEARDRVENGFNKLRPGDVILERGQPGYPARLEQTKDAPRFLFVRQDVNVLDLPSISIVGTRKASDEGRSRARRLAHLLARRGIAVCSGLALGIDEAAHLGALEAGGVTIAVIGTPLTRVYPREHSGLQERIGFVGAVVSQFHPASKTLPLCFPLRNATMSGLSLGTVVIEASETSGALVQARKALQQGRKVFIPKSAVDDARLRWPKQYADQRGAYVFSTIDDLVDVLVAEDLLPRREVAPAAAKAVGLHAS